MFLWWGSASSSIPGHHAQVQGCFSFFLLLLPPVEPDLDLRVTSSSSCVGKLEQK